MKKFICTIVAALLLVPAWQAVSQAGEVDILVKKLVEKGVLTADDASVILQETRAEAAKERQATIQATREALVSGSDAPFHLAEALPKWIKNTTFKGDFRLRWQFNNRPGSADRHRGRYRLRLGFVTKLNDKVSVGFGLASGTPNPRSTNQTMGNSFDTPDIRLDYAYALYRPCGWLTLTGGKFANPLWLPGGSFLWDSDIRPEGVTVALDHKVGPFDLFMTSSFWVIDERSRDENDPVMWVFQPGYKINLGERAYFKNALTWYEFRDVKGTVLDYSSGSNSLDRRGNLSREYDAVVVSGEFGFKTGIDLIPFAAVFGEYITNRSTGEDDDGYTYGFKFGHQKVSKKHQWQAGFSFRRLERDAWLDVFPDADAYSGQTNMKSFLWQLKYGLMDNIFLGVNYYYNYRIEGSRMGEDNLQVEVNFKF